MRGSDREPVGLQPVSDECIGQRALMERDRSVDLLVGEVERSALLAGPVFISDADCWLAQSVAVHFRIGTKH